MQNEREKVNQDIMKWYSEDLKVVKDGSDPNSSGRLLKAAEICC